MTSKVSSRENLHQFDMSATSNSLHYDGSLATQFGTQGGGVSHTD